MLTLPKGKYVIVGNALVETSNVRYFLVLGDARSSARDDCGYVGMNITDIVSHESEKPYDFRIYSYNKNITVSGYIKAIKIGE